MDIIKIIFTSLFSVVSLFIIAKIMGHKQISQLDFFDYICGITIGSIAAELATDLEAPWKSLIALAVYGLCSICLNLISRKLIRARKYINGTPTVLFDRGKIYRENLKKSKLDLSEFMLLCREQGYFDIDDIQTAIFEHNGKISILPKSTKRPATPEDLKINAKSTYIGVELIMDGYLMSENLCKLDQNKAWLDEKLKLQGYKSHKEIFLAIYKAEQDEIKLYPFR
jgi:uncharacterized membrane protein YcaP (DUF421 family)